MSERQNACQALAAMIHTSGERPSVDELRFIAHIALELGLNDDENKAVQGVIDDGGDFGTYVAQVKDREMQLFLFRQVVAAALIDDHVNDAEHAFINSAAEALNIDPDLRAAFVAWMYEGLEWEKRGAALMAQMRE